VIDQDAPQSVVVTEALTKRYGQHTALDGCSLGVHGGEVFGILGPNGAGKSTLLRLLMGYLRPTSGTALINGLDTYRQRVRVHSLVAYLPGDARLFPKMRGQSVLDFFTSIRKSGNKKLAMALADRLELDLRTRVAYMSTGMRQKLALVATFSAETPLLILDEPTANLDPNVRSEIMKLTVEARQSGQTVIFSSHILPEVEEACDRVVILRSGQLVHTQVMADLRRQHRIRGMLKGEMPTPPAEFKNDVVVHQDEQSQVVIETAHELTSLLGWLATCPLSEIQIEPVGLRAIYDRHQSDKSDGACST